jgi:curved DNA binding protein
MKKGIAFPTCVSLNHCVCHFSPLKSDPPLCLAAGDLFKIELGVHVDGFIAVVGHTAVVGATKESPVTDRRADVVQAAYLASEIAHRMVVPGGENMAVTDAIQKVCRSFECNACEGILSYQLKRNNYNTDKTIILNPSEQQRREQKSCEFNLYEAYAIDLIVSTGEGRTKPMDTRTTVFRKTDDTYQLKMKASRAFYSEVSSKFTVMPFSLRSCEEESKARMGVVECLNHNLVEPFNVLFEKDGEFVAQFKFTVLLMPNGPLRITGGPLEPEAYVSSHLLEDAELKSLLATSASRKQKKKKKKGKSADAHENEGTAVAD